jgi:hypothetical protein
LFDRWVRADVGVRVREIVASKPYVSAAGGREADCIGRPARIACRFESDGHEPELAKLIRKIVSEEES